jgi:hypothetical protein
MPIDLKRINAGKGSRLLQPRDIFAALPEKPWPRLRPEQGEVLKTWFERRDEDDLVIKQNTGGGKTLVGLLIGQSSLNEGIGPAVYLVPDTYLIKQVMDGAAEVGIVVTDDHRDERFLSSSAILVTTFDKVVNGRSTFGVRGQKPVKPLGIVIVDDAHSALNAARHQFCPTLPAECEGYAELLKLFAEDLERQSPKGYADLRDNTYTAPLRVPPKATAERASEALRILNKYGDDGSIRSFFFGWPFVADHLAMAVITFTQRAVEIRTPCPQIDLIPAFSDASRRVYLTATLADEGVLVTELDAAPESVRRPITPDRASDLGDRIILAPMSINPSLSELAIQAMAREFADGDRHGDGAASSDPINVVVLVPSERRGREWADYADEVVNVKTMGPVIERLTAGEHVGVVVLINKYDGVDLPHDACRLLIVDGVPTPLSGSEQRESAALTGSTAFEARKVQRIEQGMGRGIRDLTDYCAVLLLTRDTALTLRDPKRRQFYSPVTRAQVELSQQIADQIVNEGIDEIRNAVDMFLKRDEAWVAKSREAVADVEYDRDGKITPIAIARREAFNKAVAGNVDAAFLLLQAGIDTLTDDLEKGWALEELAGYLQLTDPVRAQQVIARARELNPGVIKSDVSPPTRPVKGPALQATAAANYLAEKYSDSTTLRLTVGSLFDNIVWGMPETADLAEEQIKQLGLHLGFDSTRPEKEDNDGGPDNLWGLSPGTNAVIELKTEVTRNPLTIVKHEAGQLLTSIEWDVTRNPHVPNRIPVLLHPGTELHNLAHVTASTRIVTESDLEGLQTDVMGFTNELAADEAWGDPVAVREALHRNKLTADQIIPAHSSKPTRSAPRQ